MASNSFCVELSSLSKQYPGGGKKANNNISLNLKRGEILCIAGENGAGKTTLMKLLCGLEIPDSGEIFINGKKETINSPLDAKNLGIGMVHQHFMLFDDYTVAQNIVMGVEPRKWGFLFDEQSAKKTAEKIINVHNFNIKSELKVKDLTLGQRQQVEICRVLHRNAQIIILDEPTSILAQQEIDSLFKILKLLTAQGKSVILITHKLREIKDNCDRVAVLRRGELAGIREKGEFDEKEIARLMMGTKDYSPADSEKNAEAPIQLAQNGQLAQTEQFAANEQKANETKSPVIEFENVTVKRKGQKNPLLENVSFSVKSGEIMGIAGVTGNGLGVIEALLGGFLHPSQGKILHNNKDISALNIRALRNNGLSYVPADRLRVGSAREAEITENMIINRRRDFFNKLLFDKKKADDFYEKLSKSFNIEGAQGSDKCAVLSGGNLQKLILAREINSLKDYIVFSEPTWGLDIASSSFIEKEIASLREKGAAIILISTNLDEILALADNIIVMYRGKIAGIFENKGDDSIKEKIGNCMQGIFENSQNEVCT